MLALGDGQIDMLQARIRRLEAELQEGTIAARLCHLPCYSQCAAEKAASAESGQLATALATAQRAAEDFSARTQTLEAENKTLASNLAKANVW